MSTASSSRATKTNPKRPLPDEIAPEAKRPKTEETVSDEDWFKGNIYPRVSKIPNADAMDATPPLQILEEALMDQAKEIQQSPISAGSSVVYWMRMNDLRIKDNRAMLEASKRAQKDGVPLVVIAALVPSEYKAHDRGPRRVDFMLRNLRSIKTSLEKRNIPLLTLSLPPSSPRKSVSTRVLELATSSPLSATHIYANMSYEVDELQRDIKLLEEGRKKGMFVGVEHDRLIVPPGKVKKKTGGDAPYTVFSPWYKVWSAMLTSTPSLYAPFADAEANEASALKLFQSKVDEMPIPDSVEGFEMEEEDAKAMRKIHPEGEDAASEVLRRFLETKARSSQLGEVSPLADGAPQGDPKKDTRIASYSVGRNEADKDTTSRISPYLTSGIISPRTLLTETAKLTKGKLVVEKGSGIGTWVSEVAWRDFYNHILAAFPRTSMGQPYNIKYRGVQWETDPTHLQAWKDGKTGYPIVDAAMRQMKQQGWMHNRCRMIVASFLCKDLMIDWRLGERYFMTGLMDGDLASNNGGWQWTASTGTDPQPYFRIFNPASQSEKADPSGDYIRHFVPELKSIKSKAIHDPYAKLGSKEFAALGYPKPIVEHKMARARALGRYKNVGEKPDEGESTPGDEEKKVAPAKTKAAVAKGKGKKKAVVESDEEDQEKTSSRGLEAFGFAKSPKTSTPARAGGEESDDEVRCIGMRTGGAAKKEKADAGSLESFGFGKGKAGQA